MPTGKRKMIVADDTQVMRVIVRHAFEHEFDIYEAENGQQVLDILSGEDGLVSVILLDLYMPVMGGHEVLKRIQADPVWSAIPVVIITGDNERACEADLLRAGAREFLLKPLDVEIARHRVRNVLAASNEERYRIIIEQSQTLVLEYDYQKKRTYVDPLLARYIPGDLHTLSPFHDAPLGGIVYPPDLPAIRQAIRKADEDAEDKQVCDVRLYTTKRTYEWYRVIVSQLAGRAGEKRRLIITLNNIHNEVVSRKELEFLAKVDSLTRIPNQDTFIQQTSALLREHPETTFVVLRIDIERFHLINQLFGPAEGDRMLKFVAVRLQEAVEAVEWSSYCRISSDLFAACLPHSRQDVLELMEELQQSVKGYPLEYEIVLSFGLYVVDDPLLPVNVMLDRASHAKKAVKGSYLTHYAYYDAALLARESEERFIVDQMERALENEEFQVYLQPKVDIVSGELAGAEALVRWLHPERGLIPPGAFIPIFERNGFVMKLDTYVWEGVCKVLRRWLDEGKRVYPVSVNVSRVDIYNPRLIDVITGIADQYRIPRELLELEVTESSFVADLMQVINLTREMRQAHFTVLMDDFGSGYSSLNALKDIDVDVLKLDMRFLSASTQSERGTNILLHTINMARSLGLSVVAEGVETEEQRQKLAGLGCDYAQGYLFGKAVPVAEFERVWQ